MYDIVTFHSNYDQSPGLMYIFCLSIKFQDWGTLVLNHNYLFASLQYNKDLFLKYDHEIGHN